MTGRREPRLARGVVLLAAGLAFCAALWFRALLVQRFDALAETSDTLALPPPEQAVVMSLGYRSAAADLIYAHTLVAYGLHFGEKRRFEYVGEYLETVTTLDPKFAQPYIYADTLLTLQPETPRQADYRKARDLMLKGTRELPYNQRLWFTAGQFLAYLAPPNLEDPKEQAQFKEEGARLLAHACELVTDNENIPYHCLTAAGMLNEAGEREALIQMLTRTLAVNDDEEIQKRASAALAKWVGQKEHDAYRRKADAFNDAWRELGHVSKEKLLLMGPPIDIDECVGPDRDGTPGCDTTWRGWASNWEQLRAAEGAID